MLLINTKHLLKEEALQHSSKSLPSRLWEYIVVINKLCQKCPGFLAITSCTIIMHNLLLWGLKSAREARTEVKHDLYLQCTLNTGLPSVLRSLYSQSKVELEESSGMLTYL